MSHTPSRAELLAALEDSDPKNPLARAIADAISDYSTALEKQTSKTGRFSGTIVFRTPATEIEAFALELFTEEIRAAGINVRIGGTE